ncbi:hypothetical protein C7M84_020094 [Penaeus vannamei]|uniref:Uncharacterized protein n=1 Tax=Penaeus vannamei TaxID=6689 RepID=A0A423SD55_PENVA|nr:hypothetical protein C7M84_020094 [Penaeus vannamei]
MRVRADLLPPGPGPGIQEITQVRSPGSRLRRSYTLFTELPPHFSFIFSGRVEALRVDGQTAEHACVENEIAEQQSRLRQGADWEIRTRADAERPVWSLRGLLARAGEGSGLGSSRSRSRLPEPVYWLDVTQTGQLKGNTALRATHCDENPALPRVWRPLSPHAAVGTTSVTITTLPFAAPFGNWLLSLVALPRTRPRRLCCEGSSRLRANQANRTWRRIPALRFESRFSKAPSFLFHRASSVSSQRRSAGEIVSELTTPGKSPGRVRGHAPPPHLTEPQLIRLKPYTKRARPHFRLVILGIFRREILENLFASFPGAERGRVSARPGKSSYSWESGPGQRRCPSSALPPAGRGCWRAAASLHGRVSLAPLPPRSLLLSQPRRTAAACACFRSFFPGVVMLAFFFSQCCADVRIRPRVSVEGLHDSEGGRGEPAHPSPTYTYAGTPTPKLLWSAAAVTSVATPASSWCTGVTVHLSTRQASPPRWPPRVISRTSPPCHCSSLPNALFTSTRRCYFLPHYRQGEAEQHAERDVVALCWLRFPRVESTSLLH